MQIGILSEFLGWLQVEIGSVEFCFLNFRLEFKIEKFTKIIIC